MRFPNVKWTLGLSLVLVGGLALSGSATAQGPTGTTPPSSPDANVPFKRQQQLTPQEEMDQANGSLVRMETSSQAVARQLQQARAQRDAIKIACLNDKLSQIDVAVRSARDRKLALQSAVARNDVELSNHEFTMLTVLRQRVEQLTAEANQCIGEDIAFIGRTEVTTQIDPTLPGDDMTQYPPTDPGLIGAPPVCVSCAN
jgi:hypothetical protein